MANDIWKKFQENPITHSGAHHLLAIYDLVNERGYARVTDIAKRLGITTGSVSTNLKTLKQRGLIDVDENKMFKPSEEGVLLAKAVLARHEIFYKFLKEVVGVSEDQSEIDACKVEHLLSRETSQKLLSFMQNFFKGTPEKNKFKFPLHAIPSCEHDPDESCNVCPHDCLQKDC
jgi:DtxR family Mn-dependent transcriptional regulator